MVIFYVAVTFIEFVLAGLYTKIALKKGIVDHPGERKMHEHSKPRGAGVSFFLVYAAAFLYLTRGHDFNFNYKLWLILGFVIFLVGFLDDILNLPAGVKLIVQIAVAVIFTLYIGKATLFLKYKWLQMIISVAWIIGIMNSFNLLDNMDGLSGGISLIVCLIFAFINFQLRNEIYLLYLLLAFIMAGFLPHNFYPSQCFMGDSGSLFIGFVISTLSMIGVYTEFSLLKHLPVLIPVIVLSVPLYDTLSVIYIRIKNKKPIFVGDKNHFSHRLFDLGLSHKDSVLFIYLVTLSTGIGSFLLLRVNWLGALVILAQVLILFVLLSILIKTGRKK